MNNIQNLAHYADVLAIPFFLLMIIYFYSIPQKTIIEYLLFIFSICGFILDIIFTFIYFRK